jgi:DNA-binding transcriptional MocR family regulator
VLAKTIKRKEAFKRPRAVAAEQFAIALDSTTDRPLFVQILETIRKLIANGTLMPGMRLPPVRVLAGQLGVNQATVARAYRELAANSLIEGRGGGGSFVRAFNHQTSQSDAKSGPQPLLAERLFELSRAPGVIAFSSNYPAADQTCIDEFRDCLALAAREKLESCFHYDPPLGRPDLRQQIQIYLKNDGIELDADNVLVTSGAQQAIDLVVRAVVKPGAAVVIEQPAYYGVINALVAARARIIEVPMQRDGMDLEILQHHLARNHVSLVYTNPTFQNPTGVTMTQEKRIALLALARRHHVPILEDDHSHELRFTGQSVPAIRALAGDDDLVLYARSFGKTFLPGMRLGFLAMPDALRHKLLVTKASADLHCNNFIQEAAALYLSRGSYTMALARIREKYAQRQKLLCDSLARGMPAGTTIARPQGGLSLWLTLPEGADVSELYYRAVRRGVAFVAGDVFYASHVHPRSMRISFGQNQPEELIEGVTRLCSVVKDLLGRRSNRTLVTS